jgi:hypothetical protein
MIFHPALGVYGAGPTADNFVCELKATLSDVGRYETLKDVVYYNM